MGPATRSCDRPARDRGGPELVWEGSRGPAGALRYLREPGSAALAAGKQDALEVFRSCVADAWQDATGGLPDPGFAAELAHVVEVFEFDSSDRQRMELLLEQGWQPERKHRAC